MKVFELRTMLENCENDAEVLVDGKSIDEAWGVGDQEHVHLTSMQGDTELT